MTFFVAKTKDGEDYLKIDSFDDDYEFVEIHEATFFKSKKECKDTIAEFTSSDAYSDLDEGDGDLIPVKVKIEEVS